LYVASQIQSTKDTYKWSFFSQCHHSMEYVSTNSYCIHISQLLQRITDTSCSLSTLLNHTVMTKCKYLHKIWLPKIINNNKFVSFVLTIWKVIKTEQTYLHFVITVWFNRVERERSKHSCETQLLTLRHELLNNLYTDKQTDLIILDFYKAFDKVPHKKLLRKLDNYRFKKFTTYTCWWYWPVVLLVYIKASFTEDYLMSHMHGW
jgi:hypothetical protein